MFEPAKKIKNSYKIIDSLGEWPSFHDAEILKVELDREGPSLEIILYTFLMLKEVDERGYYKLAKKCIITFRFFSIEELKLIGFNQQNVISDLNYEQTDKGDIKVELNSSYGLNGGFICKDIEVISVKEVDKTAI